ncbi:MAG: EamA family transporter, partial [Phycisphaerae bacterium]
MPTSAIVLVLISCFSHAGWNLLAKRSRQRVGLFWWSTLVSAALLSPASIAFFLVLRGDWPQRVWAYLAVSGPALGLYKYALARAYRAGDLSLVYPIARSAPLFVAVWAAVLLGEWIDLAGGVGIVLVVAAAVALSLPPGGLAGAGPTGRAVGWAVLTALCSSIYSVADRAAMLAVDGWFGRLVYLQLEFTGMWLGLTLLSMSGLGGGGWRVLRAEGGSIVGVGLLEPLTYLMILLALSMPAAGVSYVVTLRQFSAIVGVLFGWRLLREPRGWLRLISAVVMVGGLV